MFFTSGFWNESRQATLPEWGTLCCFDLYGKEIFCLYLLSFNFLISINILNNVFFICLGRFSWSGPEFQGPWSDHYWFLLPGLVQILHVYFVWRFDIWISIASIIAFFSSCVICWSLCWWTCACRMFYWTDLWRMEISSTYANLSCNTLLWLNRRSLVHTVSYDKNGRLIKGLIKECMRWLNIICINFNVIFTIGRMFLDSND